MRLPTRIPVALALLAAATPALAQSTSKLKKELRSMERAAKKDPEALYEAARWAKEHGLDRDAERVLKKLLKIDPDHAGGNTLKGNELVDGKWMPAKQAQKLREKALAAEYSSKGYKLVDGVWVEPDQVADAEKGIFHHDGEVVSKTEKLLLMTGKVRHPVTGQLIDKKFLDKAENGYFPLGNGKWVDRKEADKYHSDISRPWMVRSSYATIISTLPLDEIEKLKILADQGQETVAPLFGNAQVPPAKRPLIIIAKTSAEYNQYGQSLGDGSDVAGAFLIRSDANFVFRGQGGLRPAICVNDKNWGPRYVRHAAAIAYVNAIAEEAGADLPQWFVHGCGALTSRFENDRDAGWFGKQHVAKGGVGNVKSFFSSWQLSADIQPKQVDFNVFQAGLMLSFAMRGGDKPTTDAMVAVTDAVSGKGGDASKAISALEKELAKSQDKIVDYLKTLIAKAP